MLQNDAVMLLRQIGNSLPGDARKVPDGIFLKDLETTEHSLQIILPNTKRGKEPK